MNDETRKDRQKELTDPGMAERQELDTKLQQVYKDLAPKDFSDTAKVQVQNRELIDGPLAQLMTGFLEKGFEPGQEMGVGMHDYLQAEGKLYASLVIREMHNAPDRRDVTLKYIQDRRAQYADYAKAHPMASKDEIRKDLNTIEQAVGPEPKGAVIGLEL